LSRSRTKAEELLGSRGRIRTLQILAESSELNISEVSRRTGLNYTSVERHLVKLAKLGLVKEKRYGKIRIFQAMFQTLTVRFERGGSLVIELTQATPE
jgi:DNA-binding transcriptional ArsR family regulator